MPRLQLNADDLAKLKVSSWWGPFNESLASLGPLRRPRPNVLVDGWRRTASDRVDGASAPLLALVPESGYIDLHTVVGEAASMPEALERLEAAPAEHVSRELAVALPTVARMHAWARRWLRDLLDGERGARHQLVELMRQYHASTVEPHWRAVHAHLEGERSRCARVMATEGVGRLLDALHPTIRWRPPFLDVAVDLDAVCDSPSIHALDGRSLVLAPSVFTLDRPWLLYNTRDQSLPMVLVYPALRSLDDAASLWTDGVEPGRPALARLLGPTRADALEAIADTCTTLELSRRLGISPATASHHVGILRDAKLIATNRDGNAVNHRLTELGTVLLDGGWKRASR